MAGKGVKIADAVHGTIQLTPIETEILDSAAFQRLRGVKHLGLASLVFPGADFSRLAHGVGTCHVTGKILGALADSGADVTEADMKTYRAAALLHDVGHYPYSHTFERALKDHHQKTSILAPIGEATASGDPGVAVLMHEDVGTRVIKNDDGLREILERGDLDSDMISRIITRSDEPPKFTNLVSSDLDADRIDYLLRTALHTGLPYGSIDLEYLLTQIRLDSADRICYTPKGLRAAEHLLMSRFFDYAQVSFHKTVAALELVLNEAIGALLRARLLDCSNERVEAMISSGEWNSFDDAHVLALMRQAVDSSSLGRDELRLCRAVLERTPPKLLFECERFGTAEGTQQVRILEKAAKQAKSSWEDEFCTKVWVWRRDVTFTKIGPHLSLSQHQEDEVETYDRIKQAVLILGESEQEAKPIQESTRSMMRVMSENSLDGLRIYALTVDMDRDRLEAMRSRVHDQLDLYME